MGLGSRVNLTCQYPSKQATAAASTTQTGHQPALLPCEEHGKVCTQNRMACVMYSKPDVEAASGKLAGRTLEKGPFAVMRSKTVQ